MATKSAHRLAGSSVITRDGLSPLLGIEARGNLGRANQITKEHCQMPPLAGEATIAWLSEGRHSRVE